MSKHQNSYHDTIVAIATPPGRGGIGVVRLSGPEALATALLMFRFREAPHTRKRVEANALNFGTVVRMTATSPENPPLSPFAKGGSTTIIDHGYLVYFKAPNSYTGEDVVELQLHGSPRVLQEVVQLCLAVGEGLVRPAEPGEFTRRAFVQGKMDLTEAEGVADLIDAQTMEAGRLASRQVQGELHAAIMAIREPLVGLLAQVQGDLNFPEDGIPAIALRALRIGIQKGLASLGALIERSQHSWVYRDGLRVAIIGFPNEGKSSLFNALLGRDRAIVSAISGTTRDAIEDLVDIAGVPVIFTDTAGLTRSDDELERAGVERSVRAIRETDIIILVVDARDGDEGERLFWETVDPAIGEEIRQHRIIRVGNKIDLLRKPSPARWRADEAWVSARQGKHIDRLRKLLVKEYLDGTVERGDLAVTNVRHMHLLTEAHQSLVDAAAALESGLDTDTISVDIDQAVSLLGEIIGIEVSEELLEQIFSRFCIGK
ncbi:tRNA uridine-5-carboxymethylaminomethyl(34) synthesis GTPase MnmE [Candidatus Wirthbacteria bacterium CG2_30_54_11]|uniref:tRNA modification GTPase MnmE n=1 Tax=Candidatus Wirthbacteria bacterium CG2_30_54_11 TaxID=1817892 RepID=A0A1J5IKU9_9BACT|nr:MAG: tRNA uridine-5-carboxymethylaminomethyl(34) synthesis GTPase MnmE [Candidatus Wirthbacteria bacterium CG2_30_54_11]